MNKKTVLHVLGGFNYGGAETFIINLYRNIDREKVKFDVLIRDSYNPQIEEFEKLGGGVYKIASFPKHIVKSAVECRKFFMDNGYKYDAVHIHANALIYIFPILYAKKYNCKNIILHSHNTKSKSASLLHKINRFWLKKVDVCLACGIDAGKWVFGKPSFQVINNGIDAERYRFNYTVSQDKRRELGFTEDNFVIGHVGRFAAQKNHKFLVDIFESVHNLNSKSKLLLVGNGELKNEVEDLLKSKGLLQETIFLSNRTDVPELLQAMDVFLFPSLYEGLSIALIEAQAAGLPCLISDTIDPRSAICDQVKILSLKQPAEEWAQEVENQKKTEIDRSRAILDVDKSGYNIRHTAKMMEKIYELN